MKGSKIIINRSNKYERKQFICEHLYTYTYVQREREREKVVVKYDVSFACVFIYGYH